MLGKEGLPGGAGGPQDSGWERQCSTFSGYILETNTSGIEIKNQHDLGGAKCFSWHLAPTAKHSAVGQKYIQ